LIFPPECLSGQHHSSLRYIKYPSKLKRKEIDMAQTYRQLGFILLLAITCICDRATNALAEKPVNVVFFLADDVNKEYYGCYGHPNSPAQALSEFAKQGMVFDQMFTGQAICTPSRSIAFTGKYPLRNGAFKNHTQVYPSTKTICHFMNDLDYDVILCGKSHVSPKESFPWTLEMESVEPAGDKSTYTRPALPTDKLDLYLASVKSDGSRPFCIMATSYYPHGESPEGTTFTPDGIVLTPSQSDTPEVRHAESRYYQAIKNSDDEFAQVLKLLDKHNLADNTVVMFASDHGRAGKFTVSDKGLNVPFVVRWPGVVPAGKRSQAMVSFVDLLPTVLAIAGNESTEDFDGKSFLSVLRGQSETQHEYVYGVMTNQGTINAHVFPGRMIRSKKFKYIRNYNAMEVVERKRAAGETINPFVQMGAQRHRGVPEEELYRVDGDPSEQTNSEQTNLASNPEYAEIKAEMRDRLQAWLVQQNDFLAKPGNMPLLHTSDQFRLDRQHPRRKKGIPAELKNSLKRSDLYRHSPDCAD
jgi:uncharacterized sulfatase